MRETGAITKSFCAHWRERTLPSAARRALEAFIPGFGKAAIPVDLEAAAKFVGIDQVLDSDLATTDGLLSVTPSGTYVATLRAGQTQERKRFTLAHEIGHALLYKSMGRRTPFGMDALLSCRGETADERDEERLCDVIAAELLMPREQFISLINELGVCAATIPQVAQRFGVSLQATCRRVTQVVAYDVGISLWMMSDDKSHIIPKWHVTKKGTTVPEHVIGVGGAGSACFAEQGVRGWQWIPLQGQMDKYFVDVSPLRSGEAWLVVVVFEDAAQHIMATISKGRQEMSPQASLIERRDL